MKAIALVEGFIQQWGAYVLFCIDAPYSALACRSFWNWVVALSWGSGGLLLTWIVWKFVDYKLKYSAALRAQLERERVAEEDVMEKARWKGDDVILDGASNSDVAGEIRAALARRSLGLDKPSL